MVCQSAFLRSDRDIFLVVVPKSRVNDADAERLEGTHDVDFRPPGKLEKACGRSRRRTISLRRPTWKLSPIKALALEATDRQRYFEGERHVFGGNVIERDGGPDIRRSRCLGKDVRRECRP